MIEKKENNFEILEDKILEEEKNNNENLKTYEGYVGFWKRFAAQVIDNMPIFLVLPFAFIGMKPFIIVVIIFIVAITALQVYYYFTEGRGIGYKALGYKIIDIESGEKADNKKLLKRGVMKWGLLVVANIISYYIIFAFFVKTNFLENLENITSLSYFSNYNKAYMISDSLSGIWLLWAIINIIAIVISSKKLALYDKFSGVAVVSDKVQKTWKIWVINLSAYLILPTLAIIIFIISSRTMLIDYTKVNLDKVIEGKYDNLIVDMKNSEIEFRDKNGLVVKKEWTVEMVKEEAKKIKKELEFGNSNINSKVFLKDDEKKFYIDMKKTNTVEKEVEESQKK